MFKRIYAFLPLLVVLFLSACGVDEERGVVMPPNAVSTKVYTKATLKVSLVGTLPAGSSISGVGFTLYFPVSVAPDMINNAVATGVVTPLGVFSGGLQADPVYSPAVTAAPYGKMLITLADLSQTGVTQVGDVALITLQVNNETSLTAKDFQLGTNGVIDMEGKPIASVSAVVTDVILQ